MSNINSWFKDVGCLIFAVGVALMLAACGGGGGGAQVQQGDTQGTVVALIAASTAPDSDGDHLPDDVETYLGTNPQDRDTDHDGIPDFVEIFGTGFVNEASLIPDKNHNGTLAALDADDDGDGIVDGQQLDSDGDGIPDYLEYYGYTYDWMTGKYAAWDGDYSKNYFKTDPHQKSTDQDPFDDNVEITGVNMDVSVTDPGSLPMVPAYPDIVVRLEGYTVTLNQELTWTQGSSLAKGTTWDRTAETSNSNTTERNWEVGISTKVTYGLNLGGEAEFHANYGEKYGSTSGTSNSVSSGGSILSEQNWTSASTQNPVDVAHIKLFLKVYNKGTAVASNLIPTITLKIGGHNIATFEQGNAQINLLEPGSVYPATPGVYWVIDSIDTGAGVTPISLTLGELKALESGAPVSITLTQMAANVMLRNPATGAYESAGDWNEYMARIRAVSANLFFDKGDGNTVRALVYADDGITSPIITLGDALVWAAKGRQDPVTHNVFISYYDEVSKRMRETSLAGWHFAADGDTYKANGFSDANPMPADFNIATLRLNPQSFVMAKAPRAQVPGAATSPSILSAYYDPTTGGVNAVVSDYNGIKTVEFIDKNGNSRLMHEDIPDSSFYVYTPAQDIANYPTGYQFAGTELVRVTNVNNESTTQMLTGSYAAPVNTAPRIVSVSVDLANHKLTAHVESDTALDAAPAFVRLYGVVFTPALGYGNGYCQMERVSNWYADPTGWECTLNSGWTSFANIDGSSVVAYAGPGLYTTRNVTAADEHLHTNGSGYMYGIRERYIPLFWPTPKEYFDMIDFDTGTKTYYLSAAKINDFNIASVPAYATHDAWVKVRDDERFYPYFNVAVLYVGVDGVAGLDYDAITLAQIQGMQIPASPSLTWFDGTDGQQLVFVYRTNGNRYGKMRIRVTEHWYADSLNSMGTTFAFCHFGAFHYDFVTFTAP
ncbi:MAG: hypothetical protein HZB47_13860 [Nitrosomonadales bacterium]|nr:hypothetical protein [Nitrosomonadales bacterium]